MFDSLLEQVAWNEKGLVAAIAQDAASGRVLMMAWMNAEALRETLDSGYVTYWSRSRNRLWRKGESSGNRQKLESVQLDCDGDALLFQVAQEGGIACHTGRNSCFYRHLENGEWQIGEPILKSAEEMYGHD